MANVYIGARSPKGSVGVRGVLDSGELSAYSAGTLSGFEGNSVVSWTISVGGVSGTQDVAIAKNPGGESELLVGTAGQSIDFIIGGAPGTPGQSRTDALVIYKDPFATSLVNDGIDTVDYEVVAGTAAATGSQVPPDDAAIRAAIPTGSLKFVAVIGYVTIAYGQVSVSLGNYTRNLAALNDLLVPEIATMQTTLDDKWWDELGRVSLGVAGDTLSLPSLPAKKYLHIIWHCVAVTNAIQPVLRFNNDATNSYAITYSQNYGALVTTVSQSNISVASAASLGVHAGEAKVTNVLADRKMVRAIGVSDANLGAANGSTQIDVTGKWANTSAQITRVDLINLSTGDFAIGSELIVLGHD